MQINASIRRPSPIYQDWFKRARPKIGGSVSGVQFALSGRAYVAEGLTADQVEALRGHPHVIIEIIAGVPDFHAPEVRDDPVVVEPVRSAPQISDIENFPVEIAPIRRGPGRPRRLS